MTVRERNRRAYEYISRCSRKRFRRFLWALSIFLWALLIGGFIFLLSLDKPTEPEEPAPVETAEIIPAEYLTPALPRIGEFDVCAYCACCTPYAGINQDGNGRVLTASGQWVEIGQCVAVDTDIIPLGSIVTIDGQAYTALDTGVKGFVVDILMEHDAAHSYGVRKELVTWEME